MTNSALTTTRTYWLSFSDEHDGFRGVVIVDVTQAEADTMKAWIDVHWPQHAPGAEWVGAATRRAHELGCNPGGEVLSVDITHVPPPVPVAKNRLLSKDDLRDVGFVTTDHHTENRRKRVH